MSLLLNRLRNRSSDAQPAFRISESPASSTAFNPYMRNESAQWSPERTEALKNLQYDPSTFRMQKDSEGRTELYSGEDRVGRFGGQGVLQDFVSQYTQGWQQRQDALPAQEAFRKQLEDGGWTMQSPSVQTTSIQEQSGQFIDPNSGQAGPSPEVQQAIAAFSKAKTPQEIETALMEVAKSSSSMQDLMSKLSPIIGQLSSGAQVEGATMDPKMLTQLSYEAAQLEKAQQVNKPDARTVQEGEMIDGSAVNMSEVAEQASFEAAQADPSAKATVQGQLESLMQGFNAEEPPAWAAGAMRQATAVMAQRGLAASSMAGQAIIQATMESALPIAMADAQTFAQFEGQNLSNRQQAAMFGAQQRAQFLGMKFDQNFQAKVANAARIGDIANMNFSAEVQIALENSRMAQSVDLANLDARNAKMMADIAAMSQMDMANLSNVQQARVQNAQSFLQMDMANLSNAQQMQMFKAQERANALLSDTAAENASRQFNAASENQTNQFMASLISQTNQFNSQQANAMEQFNAGQSNSVNQFRAQLEAQREQFNAQNRLVIDQANARWRQEVTTVNNATINEANRLNASNMLATSLAEFNNLMQTRRDAMNFAFTSTENSATRATELAIARIKDSGATDRANTAAATERSENLWKSVGNLIPQIFR